MKHKENCPICEQEGETHYKIDFYVCGEHTGNDVLRKILEDEGEV